MKAIISAVTAAVLLTAAGASAATISQSEAARLTSGAQVLRETRELIPEDYWARARCVAVIPDLKKAAFIFGGEYGKGAMSCRAGDEWSAPVFIELAKGSWGFQAGAEQVDVVLLVMNESGVQKLLRNKVSLGADASIAAGPVGRQGQVGTDASLSAEILAYSRAQGLFAGINLSGGVLRPDEDANRDAYGAAAAPDRILAMRTIAAPTQAGDFLAALGRPSRASTTPGAPGASATPATTASVDRTATPAQTAPTSGARSTTVPATTDSDLRTQIVAMRQAIDRMLSEQNGSTGTSGSTGEASGTIAVSREQLRQLRAQLDGLLATLNARGQ
jgi:SH3 domain-containing YSC84-like protein 1